MKTKKLLSLLLAIVMVVSMMATMGITAGAIATDATPVYVGDTYDRIEFVSSVTTFSDEEQDGNLWYFYTTDETKLKVVNCYIEEDAVEGDKLHVFLKGIAVGNGLEILCKQYDAESTSWVEGVSAINGIYNVVPAPVYLDLDENTTEILEKKELDQNYNLTVDETGYEDATKVKLSWEIKDINATRTDNKVWDTENLCWKTDSSSTTINQQGTAKFTLENYSSVKVDATASFKATEPFKGTASYDVDGGKVTLDTANGNDTYSKTNVPTKVINATVTTDENDFDDLAATTKATKYGTYTVTIAKSLPTSFVFAGFNDGIAENATVNGMNASALCEYMVDNGMITEASEFDNIQIKYPYYSKLQGKNVIGTRALSLLFDTTHQESATGDTLAGDNDYTMDKSFVVYFNGSFSWDGSAFVKNS